LLVGSLALASGTAQLLEGTAPKAALLLDPFDTNARVNDLTAQLNDTTEDHDLPALEAAAETTIAFAPADARGYSLLGEIRALQGRSDDATALYKHAVDLSGTEILALTNLLADAMTGHRYVEATTYLDPLLRRWPAYWDKVSADIPIIALDHDGGGAAALKSLLDQHPPWRLQTLSLLTSAPSTLPFVEELFTTEAASSTPPPWNELNLVVVSLVNQARFGPAYGFFLSTLAANHRPLAGYIFDPHFTGARSGSFFAWQVKSTQDADVSIGGDSGSPHLDVDFIDTPARLGNVTQYLNLPAGHYKLSTTVSATDLSAPKGVYWVVNCVRTAVEMGRLPIPNGTYRGSTIDATIDIGPGACGLEQIALVTGTKTDSQVDRYSGSLTFDSLTFERS